MVWFGANNRCTDAPAFSGTLIHGQSFTASGFSGAGTKSRALTPLVVDQGTAADGTRDAQWSGAAGGTAGVLNHDTPYNPAGTSIAAPHPYISRIISGDCNSAINTGMWKDFSRPTGDYVLRSECYYRVEPLWTFSAPGGENFKTYNLNGSNGGPYDGGSVYSYLNFNQGGTWDNTANTFGLVLDGVHNGAGFCDPAHLDLNGNNNFKGSCLSPWKPANGWVKSVTEWYCTSDNTVSTGGRMDMFENSHFATNIGAPVFKGRTDAMPGTGRSWLFGGYQNDRGPNAYRYWADLRFDITDGNQNPGAHVAVVYVGNNANFLSCTKLVSQVPTAWADGSITFSFWKADLVGGTTGYIHVQPEVGSVFYTGQSATIAN